jgi:hypothetical protein
MAQGGRGRSIAAGILGVLAVVCLLATTIAVWARVTLFDSDRVASAVSDALAQPDVDAALAEYITTQLFSAVDVNAAVSNLLPSSLSRLEPAIAGGVETVVQRGLTTALGTEEVQELLTDVVRRAHAAAMRLLEGDGLVDGISVVNGEVQLNLLPLFARALTLVQNVGLLSDVQVPDLTRAGDPTEQIAELESALGRDLPPDFGQLVVYQSDRLADAQASLQSAQNALAFAKRAMWALIGLTIVLLVVTMLLARNRWRAALLLGLGAVVAMILARTAINRVVDEAPDLVSSAGAKAAITSIVGDVGSSLRRTVGLVLVVAALVALVALFRRHWRRSDLVAVGAVVAGVIVLGLLGLSIGALVLAIVAGGVVVFSLNRWWPAPAPAPAPAPEPTAAA